MLDELISTWRARRVVLCGGADGLCLLLQGMLAELGARVVRIGANADSQTLCRALSSGRTGALIVPCARDFSGGGIRDQLAALHTLLTEAREAGVPLTMLLCDEDVYLRGRDPYPAAETDAIGGQTPQGLAQSILQLYALGAARGLLGDAQGVVIVRHMPALGCGHPSVFQYGAWCHALCSGDVLTVEHPASQGAFVSPLDVAAAALCIGAHHLASPAPGAYNIGTDPRSLMPNRSAALRLITTRGGTRPIREVTPPHAFAPVLLDGSLARTRFGIRTRIDAAQALSMLCDLTAAAKSGDAPACMARQIRDHLAALS